jgi:histidinol-phosphate aminotransferase
MQRRDLLKQTALTLAAFSFSRDLFAAEADKFVQSPYADKIIKLSSNENPHGPSPAARKQMMDAVNGSNRYPWDVTTKLREEIAALTGHTKEHIVIGAGSSELLGLTAVWAALQKGNAVAPDPTFRLWMPAARRTGLSIKLVPLNAKKETDLQRMKEAMTADTKLVYLCNPGNPTGTIIPAKDLELFIKEIAPKAIILLDEAYTEFSNEPSMAHLVNDYPNLVIAKTFSKIYGMAGARVGYILAHPTTVKQLNELQPWANAGASAVSLAGALAAIKDKTFIDYCKNENAAAKAIFCKALEKAGIPYIPSHTSFVYFDTTNFGKDVKAMLEAKGIVGARTFEEGTKWLRLSIGTQDEMKQAAAALLV